jgi:hypothetical protein
MLKETNSQSEFRGKLRMKPQENQPDNADTGNSNNKDNIEEQNKDLETLLRPKAGLILSVPRAGPLLPNSQHLRFECRRFFHNY